MKNKKKLKIVIIAILLLVLIPFPFYYKDGGTKEYRAILYSITKYHKINEQSVKGYNDGWKIKILGITIYDKININVKKQEIDKDDDSESEVYESECCEGCLCGDTLELLKNIETAWTLTVVNNKGEYIYNNNSFINFHGTGKNKFAYFETNRFGKTINEIKGDMIINNNDEIILKPNDDKFKIIICKIGEEKDLIAILNCDNNFGTFTLQKQGMLNLSNEFKEIISKTKSISIKFNQDYRKNKKISESNEIESFISIINNSKIWTGAVTSPSPLYEFKLFDYKNKNIATIKYNPGHYFNININDKSYNLENIDEELLNELIME